MIKQTTIKAQNISWVAPKAKAKIKQTNLHSGNFARNLTSISNPGEGRGAFLSLLSVRTCSEQKAGRDKQCGFSLGAARLPISHHNKHAGSARCTCLNLAHSAGCDPWPGPGQQQCSACAAEGSICYDFLFYFNFIFLNFIFFKWRRFWAANACYLRIRE